MCTYTHNSTIVRSLSISSVLEIYRLLLRDNNHIIQSVEMSEKCYKKTNTHTHSRRNAYTRKLNIYRSTMHRGIETKAITAFNDFIPCSQLVRLAEVTNQRINRNRPSMMKTHCIEMFSYSIYICRHAALNFSLYIPIWISLHESMRLSCKLKLISTLFCASGGGCCDINWIFNINEQAYVESWEPFLLPLSLCFG